MTTIIIVFFFLYFAILAAERIQSLVRQLKTPGMTLDRDKFNCYVNLLTIFSLLASFVYLFLMNGEVWQWIFRGTMGEEFFREITFEPSIGYLHLCITAGIILLAGMVHTEYTIPALQFTAYGMLIVAMVLRNIEIINETGSPAKNWYLLVYLVVYSMAVPVVYETKIKSHTAFHIIEAIVSIALVFSFIYMLILFFDGSYAFDNVMMWTPIIAASVGDVIIIGMRWEEEKNWFVLIFMVLSVILFAVGKIVF